jgi:hypothetical protein
MSLDLTAMAHEIDAINKNGSTSKEYVLGQTYNSVLLDISVSGHTFNDKWGKFFVTKTDLGNYYLEFFIYCALDSVAASPVTTITGVTFFNNAYSQFFSPVIAYSGGEALINTIVLKGTGGFQSFPPSPVSSWNFYAKCP